MFLFIKVYPQEKNPCPLVHKNMSLSWGEQTNQCVEFCNGCVDTLLPRIGRCCPASVGPSCEQSVNTGDAYVDEHWLPVPVE